MVNPLEAEPKEDFNAKWPLKVIQGHLFRCRWAWKATKRLGLAYILQHNNCGLIYNIKVQKTQRAKEAKITIFDDPIFI